MNTSTFFWMEHVVCPQCGLNIPRHSLENHTLLHDTMSLVNSRLLDDSFGSFLTDIRNQAVSPMSPISPISNRMLHSPFTLLASTSITSSLPLVAGMLYEDNEDDYEFNTMLAELLGNVEVGVTDIDKVSVKIEQSSEEEQGEMTCNICLDTTNQPRKLICEHTYCDECISKWLSKNKTCPTCRIDLEEALKEKEKIENENTE